jgi:prevent-host-death family protein
MTMVKRPWTVTENIAAGVFKAKCLGLLEEVSRQRKEIVITKRGKPIARLVPVEREPPAVFGRLKGSGRIAGDILSTGEPWDADA